MDGSQDIWNRSACHCREAFWEGRGRHGGLGRLTGIAGVVEDPNHREFLLIELKRPSLTVGRKELDQLEDYVTTILTQPDFINTATTSGAAPQSPSRVDVSPPIDDFLPQPGKDGNADPSVLRLGGRSTRTRAASDDVRDQILIGYSTHAYSTCIVCLHVVAGPSYLSSVFRH